ncbi:PREDICTED: lysosome membrane protein 2-like [Acropora digitifera]|uniref:lysosome membrane protein 2-like n=1 Tax=Acropora digitifera TaxID=70779 RepID=UPI00077B1D0D|nr:PREDICTED: lysosome membrane protein 2-like [Acropora digitifera]
MGPNRNNKDVQLKPGSFVFKEWTRPSTPMYMKYFVFHVSNPDQIIDGSAIPNVTQKGPYSYREIRTNEVLNWTADQSVVTFMPNRSYVFDPETSCAGCDDKNDSFVTVNIPLLTVALWLRNTDYKKKHSWCLLGLQIEASRFKVKLFHRKTVHEILWGYTDPFLEFLKHPIGSCPGQKGLSSYVQLQYNNTYYGISAMNTGQLDINKLEQYAMWRGRSVLLMLCVREKLSTRKLNSSLFRFLHRSVFFKYKSTVTLKEIKLYRFTAPKELYLSGDVYPPNKGFCVPQCLPSGCLNVSLCQPQNPPVVISPPHFYLGNESLVKAVTGLHPNKRLHQTFVDIEPITGIVMNAAKRVQINVALQSVDTLEQTTGKFQDVIFPVMFASETGMISDAKAAEFRRKVYRPMALSHDAEYAAIALGVLCICSPLCCLSHLLPRINRVVIGLRCQGPLKRRKHYLSMRVMAETKFTHEEITF